MHTDWIIITKITLFLLWANFLPPLASLTLGDRFPQPLDNGRNWLDGRPLFGPHKTVRGVVFCLLGCTAVYPLMSTSWWVAGIGGLLAITGDLLSSFIKRRLGYKSGAPVFGLDQIFESFLPVLFLATVMPLTWWDIFIILLIFIPITHFGSSIWKYFLYRTPLRNTTKIVRSTTRIREWRACHQPLARWQFLLNFENFFYYRILMNRFFKVAGLYNKGLQNAQAPQRRDETFRFAALPDSFDGFRIMLLTDLHLDGTPGLAEAIIEQIKTIQVDLCLIGGDIRMETYGPIALSLRHLRNLARHVNAKHGILGVLGNHDCIEMVPDLEEAGIVMLVNDSWPIEQNGEKIWIIGIDDPHYYKVHDLETAFHNVPKDNFRILLSHSPEAYHEAAHYQPDLYLCGHTHGGQIRLPGRGPIFTHSKAPRFTAAGRWEYQSMAGYTSNGAGTSGVPLRFNCPGEISIIVLKKITT